jgi:hypothetical protein
VTLLVIPAMYRLISATTHSPGYVEAKLEAAIKAQELAAQEAATKQQELAPKA